MFYSFRGSMYDIFKMPTFAYSAEFESLSDIVESALKLNFVCRVYSIPDSFFQLFHCSWIIQVTSIFKISIDVISFGEPLRPGLPYLASTGVLDIIFV